MHEHIRIIFLLIWPLLLCEQWYIWANIYQLVIKNQQINPWCQCSPAYHVNDSGPHWMARDTGQPRKLTNRVWVCSTFQDLLESSLVFENLKKKRKHFETINTNTIGLVWYISHGWLVLYSNRKHNMTYLFRREILISTPCLNKKNNYQ